MGIDIYNVWVYTHIIKGTEGKEMTIQENARFTVYRFVTEYDPQNGDLWEIAKAIKNAYKLGAINEPEVEMLGYNLSRLTFEEIMNA